MGYAAKYGGLEPLFMGVQGEGRRSMRAAFCERAGVFVINHVGGQGLWGYGLDRLRGAGENEEESGERGTRVEEWDDDFGWDECEK